MKRKIRNSASALSNHALICLEYFFYSTFGTRLMFRNLLFLLSDGVWRVIGKINETMPWGFRIALVVFFFSFFLLCLSCRCAFFFGAIILLCSAKFVSSFARESVFLSVICFLLRRTANVVRV